MDWFSVKWIKKWIAFIRKHWIFLFIKNCKKMFYKRIFWYYISNKAILESRKMIKIGKNSTIHDYVIIGSVENMVIIWENTGINVFTVINGWSWVIIWNNVLIAPHCMIASWNHDHKQTKIPMTQAKRISKWPIIIEDDVWIGANSTITDGVKIWKGAVIGAWSVVTKNVNAYEIVWWVPAKVIGNRKP